MSEAIIPFPGGEMDPALAHAVEIERTLLGLLIGSRPRAYDAVAAIVTPEHFADSAAGRVYAAIGTLKARGEAADAVALHRYVQAEGLPLMDGLPYLAHLARAASLNPLAEPVAYARLVRALHAERRLAEECAETLAQLRQRDPETDTAGLIARHSAAVDEVGAGLAVQTESRDLGSALTAAVELAQRKAAGEIPPGLSTGLIDLDDRLEIEPQDFLIAAGRPGMGKSAVGWAIAKGVARDTLPRLGRGDETVQVFSLEMSRPQWANRALSDLANIPHERIKRGTLTEEELYRLATASQTFARLPIEIDDGAAQTVEQIASKVRSRARRRKVALVIIDYLQLITAPQYRADNMVGRITHVSQSLKRLAKDCDVPVLALAQLSRAVEHRPNKRPILADLRESGSLEQDADVVMFLYRDEYYLEQDEPAQHRQDPDSLAAWNAWRLKLDEARGKAELNIAKNRSGRTGRVDLAWDAAHVRFANLARQETP